MFISLIRDAAERFNLDDKAERFIGLLLGLIFDSNSGGFSGLQSRFTDAGLGDLFRSWIGTHVAENVLQPDQFSAAIGSDSLSSIASKLGVPKAAVSLAGATLLPKLIGLLTRDGVPTRAPAEALALINAMPARSNVAPAAAQKRKSGLGWRLWLIPLLLLLGAFLLLRNCKKDEFASASAPTAAAPNEVSAPAAQANARFGLENTDGNVTITGQVANDADKLKLWDALKAAFGDANLSGDITVDPNTLPAGWMDKLIAILPELKAKGLKFGFDGDKLQIDTSSCPRISASRLANRCAGASAASR
jgi:uncharacterized protein YidB (DUF937 family)